MFAELKPTAARTSLQVFPACTNRPFPQSSWRATLRGAHSSRRQVQPQNRSHLCKIHAIRRLRVLRAVLDDETGGTGLLDKPTFDRSMDASQLILDPNYEAGDTTGGKGLGGGNWRVMLLDSPTHSEELVVRALTTVVPGVSEQNAKNCYATSKQLGQALVTSCLKEHAEFYVEQLYRQTVRAVMEPDTTTL